MRGSGAALLDFGRMPLDVGAAIRASAAAPRFAALIATDVHAFAELGESRCAANPALAELCSTLLADHDVPVCDCDGKGLTDDDARVVALFLCTNTGVKVLECVRGGARIGCRSCPHPQGCRENVADVCRSLT